MKRILSTRKVNKNYAFFQAASWFSHFSLSPSSPPLILEAGEFSKRGAARYQLCIFFNIAQKAFRVNLRNLIFAKTSLTYSMFTADFFLLRSERSLSQEQGQLFSWAESMMERCVSTFDVCRLVVSNEALFMHE